VIKNGMNGEKKKRFYPSVFIMVLGAMLVSCQSVEVPEFDPLLESPTPDLVEFVDLKISGKLNSGHLKKPRGLYRVGAGDTLSVEELGKPQTRTTCLVLPDGKIYYGLAGEISAAGKTVEQIETALEDRLEELTQFGYIIRPVVNINILNAVSQGYTILGQVTEPGNFGLASPTTLLDAIAKSGGYSDSADLQRSIVVRDNKVVPVDFEILVEHGDMSQNIYLKPGDYIFIPTESTDSVYVMGAVKGPVALPYTRQMTLVSAFASAGGPVENSFAQRTLLLRGSLREPKVAVINFNSILKGRYKNFRLRPGDVIWVPKTPWRKLKEYGNEVLDFLARSYAVRAASETFGDDDDLAISRTLDINPQFEPIPEPAPAAGAPAAPGTAP